ncbi:Rid family hydrolase [Actinokineospora sp.]|uniref:Rid family hydrolase n=1 Tax=Actinokineospora sp. TaxID=1872133 RepID=UPI003D6AF7F8
MTAKITRLNPDQLHVPPGYHHVTVVEAGRTAYLAGQCPIDVSGALVGDGDINTQIDQVAENAVVALAAVLSRTTLCAQWCTWSLMTVRCSPLPGNA